MGEAWEINNNSEWERTRWLGSYIHNAGMVARGGKVTPKDLKNPMDMFPLPIDKEVRKAQEKAIKKRLPTKEDIQSFYERAVKAGVKLKPQNFDNFRVRTIHDEPPKEPSLLDYLGKP